MSMFYDDACECGEEIVGEGWGMAVISADENGQRIRHSRAGCRPVKPKPAPSVGSTPEPAPERAKEET